MLNHFKIIIFLFLGFLLSSCAFIKNGTTQKIAISSIPSGANVYIDSLNSGSPPLTVNLGKKNNNIDSLYRGVTPLTVNLGRKNDYWVQIEKLGYDKHIVLISHSMYKQSFVYIVSDFFLGLFAASLPASLGPNLSEVAIIIGLFVPTISDFNSGALNKLSPEGVYAKLQKSETKLIDKQDQLLAPENK